MMAMPENVYTIRIGSATGDEVFDEDSCVQTWDQVAEVIPEFSFQIDNKQVRLIIDWGRAAEYARIRTRRTVGAYLSGTMPEWPPDFSEDLPRDSDYGSDPDLVLSCAVQTSADLEFHWAVNHIEYFLYQAFLALNLSSPGCFDLWDTSIHKSDTNETERFQLSSFTLGQGFESSRKQGWPGISPTPLQETWDWLQELMKEPHLIAQTRTERALFALLHFCKNVGSNPPDPTLLTWLAHALEAIFDTPEMGITKSLRDRIFLVLGKPATHSNKVKKLINSFYQLRSAFVHGELEIPHPLGSREGEHLGSTILDASYFAISVILASLQLLIRSNWSEFEFTESFTGQPF
jgi:hypothetical protein